ncbi:MAG: 2,4'-dihydroxyacetophenone dioxygenase family protein [Hyphomonadaceae bacterium]|nr:2,4'-dihydroxyacetophenone dioxygenase family protein [Hyphomonadaceae bacterium]
MKYESIGVTHVSGSDLPWVPWEVGEGLAYKLFKVDPVHGVMVAALLAPAGTQLGRHRHTGFVQLYTIQGAWKYNEHNWIARGGDVVYETANSIHSFTILPGEDVVTFIVFNGTLEFLDDDDNLIHTESWQSMLERQNNFIRESGTEVPDVTSFEEN